MATLENLLSKMVEKINNKVSLESQSLTEAQKSQVRNNIGACALTTANIYGKALDASVAFQELGNLQDELNEINSFIEQNILYPGVLNIVPSLSWDGQLNNRVVIRSPQDSSFDYNMVQISQDVFPKGYVNKDNLVFTLSGLEGVMYGVSVMPLQADTVIEYDEATMWIMWFEDDLALPLMVCLYEDTIGDDNSLVPKGTYVFSLNAPIDAGDIDPTFEGVTIAPPQFYVQSVIPVQCPAPSSGQPADNLIYRTYPFTVNNNVLSWDGSAVIDSHEITKSGVSFKHIFDNANKIIQLMSNLQQITFILANGTIVTEQASQLPSSNYLKLISDDISEYPTAPGLYVHPDVRTMIYPINIEPYVYNQIDSKYYHDVEKYMDGTQEMKFMIPISISYPAEDADMVAWDDSTHFILPGNVCDLTAAGEKYSIQFDNNITKDFEVKEMEYGLFFGNENLLTREPNEVVDGFPFAIGYSPDIDYTVIVWSRAVPEGTHTVSAYKGTKQFKTAHIPMKQLIDENIDYIYEKILERTEQLKNA